MVGEAASATSLCGMALARRDPNFLSARVGHR